MAEYTLKELIEMRDNAEWKDMEVHKDSYGTVASDNIVVDKYETQEGDVIEWCHLVEEGEGFEGSIHDIVIDNHDKPALIYLNDVKIYYKSEHRLEALGDDVK